MKSTVAGLDVSRETIGDLQKFADLVCKWTPKINLIARSSVETIWDRHILDSVQIYRYAPTGYKKWVDIGSGGGFPGIVMAIIAKSSQPDASFVLIESDQRKSAFLRTAARELGLSVTVLAERIEVVEPLNADVVSARAVTALSGLLPLATRHLAKDGLALLHKGKQAGQEVSDAQQAWSFELEDYPSFTDPEARILAIQRIFALG